VGCVEAAVIAGRMVARSITGADIMVPGDGNSDQIPIPISALPLLEGLRKLKESAAGGAGSMDAYCMTFMVQKQTAQNMLARGLHIVPTDLDKDGLRPIVLLFTRQRHVRPGFVPFGGINYHELIVMVPFVQRDDMNAPMGGPFSYMPSLVLDEWLPVALGVNLYGLNKRLGRIDSKGGSFDVSCDLGEVRGWLESSGLPGRIEDHKELQGICGLVERPFIALSTKGMWIYSQLDFCLDTAEFQPVTGALRSSGSIFPASYSPGDRPQHNPWFRFSTHWRLSLPFVNGRPQHKILPKDIADFAQIVRTRSRTGLWR
jgi:hypothetical protein